MLVGRHATGMHMPGEQANRAAAWIIELHRVCHASASHPRSTAFASCCSDKFGLVYVITKLGLLFVYDLETATAVYRTRISPDPVFLAAGTPDSGGFVAINRCGAGGGVRGVSDLRPSSEGLEI